MAAKFCTKCGTQNNDADPFCLKCGQSFASSPASIASPSTAPSPVGGGFRPEPQFGGGAGPRGKIIGLAVVFVILILVVIVVLWALTSGNGGGTQNSSVDVTAVNVMFSGATSQCWTPANSGGAGPMPGGSTFVAQFTLRNINSVQCTVQSVAVSTSGFSITNSNTPLVVPPMTQYTLSATLKVPNSDYTGVLTLDATDTSP